MFNKNDPLIDSVKKVMEQNERERQAKAAVNEKFGIQDRKALPHQKQGEWDAEYKKILSEGVTGPGTRTPGVKTNPGLKDGKNLPGKPGVSGPGIPSNPGNGGGSGGNSRLPGVKSTPGFKDGKNLPGKPGVGGMNESQADAIKNLMNKSGRNASGVPKPASQTIAQHTPAANAARLGNSPTGQPTPSDQHLDKSKLGVSAIQNANKTVSPGDGPGVKVNPAAAAPVMKTTGGGVQNGVADRNARAMASRGKVAPSIEKDRAAVAGTQKPMTRDEKWKQSINDTGNQNKANFPAGRPEPAKPSTSGQAQAATPPAKTAPTPAAAKTAPAPAAKAAPVRAKSKVVARVKPRAAVQNTARPVAKVKPRSRLQSRYERDNISEQQLDEISSNLARRYIKAAEKSERKARGDLYQHSWLDMKDKRNGEGLPPESAKKAHDDLKLANKRESGISLARGKLTGDQHKKWEKPKGKRNITQVTKDTKVLTVKEETLSDKMDKVGEKIAKTRKLSKILKRRFGKDNGKDSVSQSRREDK